MSVLYQLGALDAFAQVAGTGVAYVKPHGALYHACITHPEQAEAVATAAHEYDPSLAVLGAPGSPLLAVVDALGMEPVAEAFADRAYRADGTLVPRTEPDAVLTDPAEVVAACRCHRHRAAASRQSTARAVDLDARSICIHGDTPGAVALARAVQVGARARGRSASSPSRGDAMRILPMGPHAVLIERARRRAGGLGGRAATTATPGVDRDRAGVQRRCSSSVPTSARWRTVRRTASARCVPAESTAGAGATIRSRSRFGTTATTSTPWRQRPGSTIDDVVALHTAPQYVVAFCGFSPGFGYLRGLDQRLHLPRRSTPRTRVPAGSVAIAAEYTAVYPRTSPGGWHLLGRTDVVMFDPDRSPPAAVRARCTGQVRGRMRASIEVVDAGIATTVQDRGRPGLAHLGVPLAGAVDPRLAALTNRLVGNPVEAALIETCGNFVMRVTAAVLIATSSELAPLSLAPGDRTARRSTQVGLWHYVAVRGGIDAVDGARFAVDRHVVRARPGRCSTPATCSPSAPNRGRQVAVDQAPRSDAAGVARVGPRARGSTGSNRRASSASSPVPGR